MSGGSETQAGQISAFRLSCVFGFMYFVQGLAEPSEGLIAQPVRSLLIKTGNSPQEIAHFMAVVSVPWMIKPLYGLLIDFLPFGRSRHRRYLLLATLITTVSLTWLGLQVPARNTFAELLLLLIIPTIAVAFSDVVVDALMIEKGQPLGLTGRLQSVQWGAMYAATLLAGSLGGWMSHRNRQDLGFLICGAGSLLTWIITCLWIHDSPHPREQQTETVRIRLRLMGRTFRDPHFLVLAGFLFLWNFNPFSSTIQHLHMTTELHLTDQEYGHTYSLFSLGSIGACLVYGFLCRRMSEPQRVHLAIVGGVVSTLTYLLAVGPESAFAVSVFAGLTYMLGNLILMDLAARNCPPEIGASLFAMLMSVSNLSIIAATSLGGWLYERLQTAGNPSSAWTILILTGAIATAMCWLLNGHGPFRITR